MPEAHSTRGCRRVGGGRRTREGAQQGYSETLGDGERSLRACGPARRHRRQRNKMVVGKAEGWALCRRKPRYSVCLLTGRAKSPPLELPGACGGSARDSACGWREARRTALRRRSVAAGPAHARTVDQPRRPAIGPPACVASLRRPFRFRRYLLVRAARLPRLGACVQYQPRL